MRYFEMFLFGIVAFASTLAIETVLGLIPLFEKTTTATLSGLITILIFALSEEVAKLAPAIVKRVEGPEVFLKYAIISAWAFAIMEDLGFQMSNFTDHGTFIWMRPALVTSFHIIATFISASFWLKYRNRWGFLLGLSAATLLHFGFNFWVLKNLGDTELLFLTNLAFFLVVMRAARLTNNHEPIR